jgi:RNA polymerase sigma-70 factor (ECF subfamily)
MNTDEELMVAYINGDESAFDTLFQRYAPMLLRIMRRQLQRREDAPGLVQQTFLQLHRARHDYQPERPLRPWLMTIAYNLKREYLRRCKRRPEVLIDREPAAVVFMDPLVRRRTAARVRAAIEQLPAGQRDVIVMHWLDELSFPEISAIVGLTLSGVKVRAHRGYKTLRALLRDDAHGVAA